MTPMVETSTPAHTPTPIGPYSHIAKVGSFISIGGTAGFNTTDGQLAGSDVYSQARQILASFRVMLESVGSNLDHVVHVNVFLKEMRDFEEMNRAYVEVMGSHRPASNGHRCERASQARCVTHDEPDGSDERRGVTVAGASVGVRFRPCPSCRRR